MKTLKCLFTSIGFLLKKIFFKSENTTINGYGGKEKHEKIFHNYEIENRQFDEYVNKYKGTTRWQTI